MKKKIQAETYEIEFSSLLESSFSQIIKSNYSDSKIVIFVDENTQKYCLDYLLMNFDFLSSAEIISIPAGEESKSIEICFSIWEALSEYKISRKDLIINLGGGVVSDLGGFVASIFKRGLDFINIPTTLLAMVDASVGGKTGIDLGNYKNQLGVFSNPKAIFIDETFLETLAKKEKVNAFAEMLKHALISSKKHWDSLLKSTPETIDNRLIFDSVNIKNEVVKLDFLEKNVRKTLNFGHTFGHAFEGFFLHSTSKIAHGEAVALGILCEAYLSMQKKLLDKKEFERIEKVILDNFNLLKIKRADFDAIFDLMKNDKKNQKNEINCVLLTGIGTCVFDQIISEEEVKSTLEYLNSLS